MFTPKNVNILLKIKICGVEQNTLKNHVFKKKLIGFYIKLADKDIVTKSLYAYFQLH